MATQNIVLRAKKKKAAALVQRNQFAEAKVLYSQVCVRDQRDVDAWWNLAQVNVKLGLHEEAAASYRQLLNIRPDHGEAYMGLGIALQSQGRLDEARRSYRKARQLMPDSAAVYSNLGTALAKQGKMKRAALSFERALALQPDLVPVLYNLGAIYQKQGRLEDAVENYRKTLELQPEWQMVRYALATALLPLGRINEAIENFSLALKSAPEHADAWLHLGTALLIKGELVMAREALQNAIRLRPDDARAYAKLAEAHERSQQLDEARKAVNRALELQPGLPIALLQAAKLERRAGHYEKACEYLDRVIGGNPAAATVAETQVERGFLADRMGEYPAAFKAFTEGQQVAAMLPNAVHLDKAAFLNTVADNRDWFTKERVETWQDTAPDDGLAAPVFLVGFPRSGTTLTEQILASHPGLVTSDERPMLNHVLRRLQDEWGGAEGYPACLDQLDGEGIRALRAYYWEQAGNLLGPNLEGKRLVDKHPLNSVHLGLIRRLFPEAKILFALRDPRDTCLSCFMQSFKPNLAMVNFFQMESTARAYTAVMGLWRHYRTVLGLQYLEFRYEDLVHDLEGTAGRLLEFIGEAWDPALLRFYEHTKDKQITTPSYQAVTSPIYSRSVGHWRNYREQLAPVLPVLQPFVELFGYDAMPEKNAGSGGN